MRWVLLLLIASSLVGCNQGGSTLVAASQKAGEEDLRTVDEYLEAWSLLVRMPTAEDAKQMAGELKKRQSAFEDALARLLASKDPRAAGRLVYSQVVQVGAFLDADSKLGAAAAEYLKDDVPVTAVDGDKVIFSGDLYLWWRKHSDRYKPYRVLEDWERSGIAKQSVIPMYLEHAQTANQVQPATSATD